MAEIQPCSNMLAIYILINFDNSNPIIYDEILLLANNFNETVCEPPLPQREVKYKVKKAFKKDRSKCMFIRLNGDEEGDDV